MVGLSGGGDAVGSERGCRSEGDARVTRTMWIYLNGIGGAEEHVIYDTDRTQMHTFHVRLCTVCSSPGHRK